MNSQAFTPEEIKKFKEMLGEVYPDEEVVRD